FFFFSSRRRHTRFSRDWSSDVCSSDLVPHGPGGQAARAGRRLHTAGIEAAGGPVAGDDEAVDAGVAGSDAKSPGPGERLDVAVGDRKSVVRERGQGEGEGRGAKQD